MELLEQGHYESIWSELSERKPLKEFLLQLFSVLQHLARNGSIFPVEWRTMHCVVNRVILTSMNYLTQPLTAYFLDSGWFDSQVIFICALLLSRVAPTIPIRIGKYGHVLHYSHSSDYYYHLDYSDYYGSSYYLDSSDYYDKSDYLDSSDYCDDS